MTIELHKHTIEKLKAVVKQVDSLLLSDFPHESSEDALKLFRCHFSDQIERVERATAEGDKSLLVQACLTANSRITLYLPLLGFLLRSTNVRNNFECYDALLQLARRLIGLSAKIIISSEWEMSPLTYALSVPVLPGYVLLGMPSTESSNALILPLAGHELGHSVWANEDLENKWATGVEERIHDYLLKNEPAFRAAFPAHADRKITKDELSSNIFFAFIISDISKMIFGQMEETFCDAIGMHIFRESFVHAFHYLLAPGFGGDRDLFYPTLRARAQFMVDFGGLDFARLGYADFPGEFHERQPRLGDEQKFLSQAADSITQSVAKDLYAEAALKVRADAEDLVAVEGGHSDILLLFKKGIPARRPRSLPDILNAGWQYVREESPSYQSKDRPIFEWTSELVLKSIEVLEFRRRMDA